MTPDLLLLSIEELLTPAITASKGKVLVCSDRMHGYEELLGAPAGAYRAAVSLAGMKPAGNAQTHVWAGPAVEIEITIAVTRAAGLPIKQGKAIYEETANGGASLLQRSEQVRRLMAGARWMEPNGEPRPDVDPGGCRFDGGRVIHLEQSDPDGGFLPVAEYTFKLLIVLPEPAEEEHQNWTETEPEAVPS